MSNLIINPYALGQTELEAVWGDALVDLTWTAVPNATAYEIGYASTPGGPYTYINVGSVLAYELGGLRNGVALYVVRRAIVGEVPQDPSNEAGGSPTNSTGYAQLDADAGWRNPAGALKSVQSQHNRNWTDDLNGYLRAVRGIYNNISGYPEGYLPLSVRPSRMRYRMRDGATINTSDFTFYLRSQNAAYSNNAVYLTWLNGGVIELWSRTSGSSALLANGTSTGRSANSTYLVEILDTGSAIQMYINGSLRLNHSTSVHNTFFNCGFSIYTGSPGGVCWLSYDQNE